jgi:hypothetical protein
MSYENQNGLNDLDVATPLDGATPHELLLAFRQLKAVVKNALLTSHYPDGRLRQGSFSNLEENSVGTAQLQDGCVTLGKIGVGAVTTTALANGSVTESKLADGSVTEDKYASNSIPAAAYKLNTIPLAALSGFITRAYISAHPTNDTLRAVVENAIANDAVTDRTIKDVAVGKLTGGDTNDLLYNLDGAWTPVPLAGALTFNPTTNEFELNTGVKAAIIGDVKGHGIAGGAGVANSWNLRSLGEISDPDNLTTFSANKFKLIPGKYLVYIECPALGVGKHQAVLKNFTENTIAIWGSSEYSTHLSAQTRSNISGVFEVTDSSLEFGIEHYIFETKGSSDFGSASSAINTTAPYNTHTELYTNGFLVRIS